MQILFVRVFLSRCCRIIFRFFFFNDTATTEIYTLSLHDALPISLCCSCGPDTRSSPTRPPLLRTCRPMACMYADRKSTRLNSSHLGISYAVFCLKKKLFDGIFCCSDSLGSAAVRSSNYSLSDS